MLLDLLDSGGIDQRPLHDAGFRSRPDLERAHPFGELLRERVVDRLVDEEPIGAHARLAAVAVFGNDGAFRCGVEIGVVEDDERRVAAEFQRDFLDRRRHLLHQKPSDVGRAGERKLAHAWVRAHLGADRRCLARDDVEDAGREACAMRKLGERER